MKLTVTLIAALTTSTLAGLVLAEKVSIKGNSKTQVEGRCGESGGVFFPSSHTNSTYGCLNKDGSGIVCGGYTKAFKKTCDTFRTVPPHLPTRAEIIKAEGKVKK